MLINFQIEIMSNLPPSTFNSTAVPPQMNSISTGQVVNHSQPNQISYTALKPDPNSNQYHPPASMPYSNMNNYNESANSSPARPPPNMVTSFLPSNSMPPNMPISSQYMTSAPQSNVPQRMPPVNHSQAPPLSHINVNTPPLVPSSQPYHPNFNGSSVTPSYMPPTSKPIVNYNNPYPVQPNAFGNHPVTKPPIVNNMPPTIGSFPGGNVSNAGVGPPGASSLLPSGPLRASPAMPGPPAGPLRASPAMPGPPSGPLRASPAMPGPPSGPSRASPGVPSLSAMGPPRSSPAPGPAPGPPRSSGTMMPPNSTMPPMMPSQGINGPPVTQMGQPKGPVNNMHMSGPNFGPMRPPNSMLPPMQQSQGLNGPPGPPTGPPNGPVNTHNMNTPPLGPMGPPSKTMNAAPARPVPILGPPGSISNVPLGPPQGNMQQRYPQQPINNQVPSLTPFNTARQSTDPYNTQGLTQQMGQLSVTKQGFDQLWGHQMVDLMQCRHILPEYPEDPPEIKLGNQFSETANCSPE